MTPSALFYGKLPSAELVLDGAELAARLKMKREAALSLSFDYESALRAALDAGYVGMRTPFLLTEGKTVDFGFAAFESRDLCRHLTGCKEALLLCVTLGFGVDRLLQRAAVRAASEQFVLDAYASAFAEAALSLALRKTAEGASLTLGFGVGYGDFPLTAQAPLLAALKARERLSVSLTKTLLMSPSKTITAVFGVR